MLRTADDLYQEALQLPEADRCHPADLLEASISSAAIEQSWLDETSRRLESIEQGDTTLVDWAEVKLKLEAKHQP